MQGHKHFVDKVVRRFRLSERVPRHNLYRRLGELLDWGFILYFPGYEVDEDLPWHSTISLTRQLYPAAVFEHLFDHVNDYHYCQLPAY
jgi:hypothetical protein